MKTFETGMFAIRVEPPEQGESGMILSCGRITLAFKQPYIMFAFNLHGGYLRAPTEEEKEQAEEHHMRRAISEFTNMLSDDIWKAYQATKAESK